MKNEKYAWRQGSGEKEKRRRGEEEKRRRGDEGKRNFTALTPEESPVCNPGIHPGEWKGINSNKSPVRDDRNMQCGS
jgi:hypothetical protein